MHPKKVILLVDANENNLSILAFSLDTNGYEVLQASSFAEGLKHFIKFAVDLAAVDYDLPGKNGDELIIEMKKLRRHTPMVLLADPAKFSSCHADRVLPAKRVPMAEVLDCFKVMMARKRGPRKGTLRAPGNVHKLAAGAA